MRTGRITLTQTTCNMRRPRRNCRKRCMGCDTCWICRRSYPNSVIVTPGTGYGSSCCAGIIGTHVTAPWGTAVNLDPSSASFLHYGFGTSDDFPVNKFACGARWLGRRFDYTSPSSFSATDICTTSPLHYASNWSVNVYVGGLQPYVDIFGLPVVPNSVGGNTYAAFGPSREVVVDLFVEYNNSVSRLERHRIDLPKPCPDSGVFDLNFVKERWAGSGTCNLTSTLPMFSVSIEITDP